MLRLWFGETTADAIDLYPLLLELEHGESFAVVPTLSGELHRIAFAQTRFPSAVRITLPLSQLGMQSTEGDSLREQLAARLESGLAVTAFIESTGIALNIAFTALRPAALADEELTGTAGQQSAALEGIVAADGAFTDFNSLASVTWRARS
jgi:hypothetical protein